MATYSVSRKFIVGVAIAGVCLGYVLAQWAGEPAHMPSDDKSVVLLQEISQLKAELAEIKHNKAGMVVNTANNVSQRPSSVDASVNPAIKPINNAEFDQQQKDLVTNFIGDPRTFVEKASELMSDSTKIEAVPLVAKSLIDMAGVKEIVSDHDLDTLYSSKNPDIQRVAAQVMSMRGDNRLIETRVAELSQKLNTQDMATKRQALTELARLRHAAAANAILPALNDERYEVRLDALLALKTTGNETHVDAVRALERDPNDSVSWLATDVIETLQNLSSIARTKVAAYDASEELPVN